MRLYPMKLAGAVSIACCLSCACNVCAGWGWNDVVDPAGVFSGHPSLPQPPPLPPLPPIPTPQEMADKFQKEQLRLLEAGAAALKEPAEKFTQAAQTMTAQIVETVKKADEDTRRELGHEAEE